MCQACAHGVHRACQGHVSYHPGAPAAGKGAHGACMTYVCRVPGVLYPAQGEPGVGVPWARRVPRLRGGRAHHEPMVRQMVCKGSGTCDPDCQLPPTVRMGWVWDVHGVRLGLHLKYVHSVHSVCVCGQGVCRLYGVSPTRVTRMCRMCEEPAPRVCSGIRLLYCIAHCCVPGVWMGCASHVLAAPLCLWAGWAGACRGMSECTHRVSSE